ncbi:MAG: UMP kinase [Gemmataceae bacterium]
MSEQTEAESLEPKYKRVLLKLSGEAFGAPGTGVDPDDTLNIATQARRVAESGVELAIVVGGGNIVRGSQFTTNNDTTKRATADYMGMLGTVINGLALQDALESLGCATRLQTAVRMDSVAEPYIRRRCVRHLEKGRIVILAGGTGNPLVTTDTAAALRAREVEAEVLMKATKVDGVYNADPTTNPHAIRYDKLTFNQVIQDNLRVMDTSAIDLCREGNLPILVFNYQVEGNIEKAIAGHSIGTLVTA